MNTINLPENVGFMNVKTVTGTYLNIFYDLNMIVSQFFEILLENYSCRVLI
jgi:hypothetical protein